MRVLPTFAFFEAVLGCLPAAGREFVHSNAEAGTRMAEWLVSGDELGITTGVPFAIRKRQLHGGKQEGVELIEVDNGRMKFWVILTRGMNVLRVSNDDVTLDWSSPVKEIVNPAYIDLESRGGLGYLDGFNEWLVRCGFEFAGHPGICQGRLPSLHGRVGNTPASKVAVVIDDQPPHRLRFRGKVTETVFTFVDLEA